MKNAGITVLVVSNNKDSRIKRVVEKFDLDYVARALKPTARGFKLAEKLGLKPSEMLMVGDQIMTDIRGANAAGIRNVLVQPIVDTDGWNTRINRFFERKIMKYLSKTSRNDMERRIRMTEAIHCIGCGAIIKRKILMN